MLPASRVPPPSRRAPNWGSGRGAHLGTPSSSANHTAAASQPTGWIAKAASWLHLLRVSPALHPPERPSHTHSPKPAGFGGSGHEILDNYVVVVVVVFTLTDRASTIPSNIRGCQSGTWSQRGTKVNGSRHGDNPLLRPTGIQIATKSYATLQAMAPTNSKTVHQTSFTPYREQPRSTISSTMVIGFYSSSR